MPALSAEAPPVALRETCRLVRGAVPLWPFHRARLAAGGCGPGVLAAAETAVRDAAAAWAGPDSSRVRLTLVVGADSACEARVERRLSSLDVPGGPRLTLVEVDAPPALPPGAAKPADRAYWLDAQRRAKAAGGDIAVIATRDGRLVDAGTSTLWLVLDGAIATPPAPPAVAGVARAFLLDALAREGAPARVEPLTLADLERAEGAFLTNAFGGFAGVRGRGDAPAARLARELFERMWAG